MRCEIVRDVGSLAALEPQWEALWEQSALRPVNLLPSWVEAWRREYGGTGGSDGFEGELVVVACREGKDLAGIAPFYLTPPRGGTLRARELRLLGHGPIGVRQAVLAAAGAEVGVTDAVIEALDAERGWDLLDLTLCVPPSSSAAEGHTQGPTEDFDGLGMRFAALGRKVQRDEAVGRPAADLYGPWERWVQGRNVPAWLRRGLSSARVVVCELVGARRPVGAADPLDLLATLAAHHFPSRLGGDARAGAGGSQATAGSAADVPPDAALFGFLQRVLPSLSARGLASLRLLESSEPGAPPVAGHVVISDGERRVEVVRGGGGQDGRSADMLTFAALQQAVAEGSRRFEFAETDIPVAVGRSRGVRLRVFSTSAVGRLQHGYASIVRRATTVAEAALNPLDQLRPHSSAAAPPAKGGIGSRLLDAAPEVVTRAVQRVATLARLHLYRGELFVRNRPPAPGLTLRLLTYEDYVALPMPERAALLTRLELDETYSKQKWDRGDLVVVAWLDARPTGHGGPVGPAGILWCARGSVYVPDIGRPVRPQSGEGYIHDVFVAPDARGRDVAPAMLEFLARELRRRDIYRAWALIERSNTASTRAFEKAAYASVADVIYARMGRASKLLVRPPDPEARALLGLVK